MTRTEKLRGLRKQISEVAQEMRATWEKGGVRGSRGLRTFFLEVFKEFLFVCFFCFLFFCFVFVCLLFFVICFFVCFLIV